MGGGALGNIMAASLAQLDGGCPVTLMVPKHSMLLNYIEAGSQVSFKLEGANGVTSVNGIDMEVYKGLAQSSMYPVVPGERRVNLNMAHLNAEEQELGPESRRRASSPVLQAEGGRVSSLSQNLVGKKSRSKKVSNMQLQPFEDSQSGSPIKNLIVTTRTRVCIYL